MTDFDTLTDAFAELERRADAFSAQHAPAPAGARSGEITTIDVVPVTARRRRIAPAFATAAGVLGVGALAIGITVARGGSTAHDTAQSAAGSGPAVQTQPAGTSSSAVTTAATGRHTVPSTAAQLEDEFRAVLAATPGIDPGTTFTVTDTGHAVQMTLPGPSSTAPAGGGPSVPAQSLVPNGSQQDGAAIVGTLTSAGVTGGYDLQILRTTAKTAQCDDPDRSRCSVSTLADGGSLAIGREPLQGGGVTYEADLVRTDGVELLMHVSNARDPKGDSTVLAPNPPLTTAQLTSLLTSPGWA